MPLPVGTNTSFDAMLKKYMPYDLLFEEMIKRDYFLMKVEKDQNWRGGEMQIPFRGGRASSFKYAGLTAEGLITEDKPVLGTLSNYKEIWGSMVFNDHDLARHDSMEASFIKILPDQLEEFIDNMKQQVSINLLNGAHLVSFDQAGTLLADLQAGKLKVDRPARLTIGQYIEIGSPGDLAEVDQGGTIPAQLYVKSIDMNTKLVEFTSDIALTLAVDFDPAAGPADPVAVGDKGYIAGAITAADVFSSLPDQLLSAANGGSATLFGQTKTAYPHLQAQNFDGSGIASGTDVLPKVFDFYNETRQIGKGAPTDVVMSYKHLGNVMKDLETSRDYTTTDSKASVYGWTEIDVVGVKGKLKLVGVNEMDDDKIEILDWRSMKLHSNKFFERRTSPEGRQFYETRSTSGYKYIVDTRFYGELVVNKPSYNGIIHSISY